MMLSWQTVPRAKAPFATQCVGFDHLTKKMLFHWVTDDGKQALDDDQC